MSIKSKIVFEKAKIKLLCKQYSETPSDNPDADLLLGVIEVRKAELLALEGQLEFIEAHNLRINNKERVTCV